jgi:hypothetical protein
MHCFPYSSDIQAEGAALPQLARRNRRAATQQPARPFLTIPSLDSLGRAVLCLNIRLLITGTRSRAGLGHQGKGCTMPSQEQIDGQQQLLSTHRRTLAHYLRQQAELGSAYTPPGIASGIREARDSIQRIKKALRNWNIEVTDHPDDNATGITQIHDDFGSGNLSIARDDIGTALAKGSMSPTPPFYIERSSDRIALEAIKRQGVTLTIQGSSQTGKSSLLFRLLNAAKSNGKRCVYLDFQHFDLAARINADIFFRQFSILISDELGLEDKTDGFWKRPLGNAHRCSYYMERYILKQFDNPLMLAMDETSVIFNSEFRSEFFSMLRHWDQQRGINNDTYKRLDIIFTSTINGYQLITNENQSPFNVGAIVDLEDFTIAQVVEMNSLYGSPFNNEEIMQLIDLVNGHPYLTVKIFDSAISTHITLDEIVRDSITERSIFIEHLRYYLLLLLEREELLLAMKQVLESQTRPNERLFLDLKDIGLVKEKGRKVLVRCNLYNEYFAYKLK